MPSFQQLQELMILTPFNINVDPSGRHASNMGVTVVVEDRKTSKQSEDERIKKYYDYIQHMVHGLQGDDVIAVRVVHLPDLASMEVLYTQALPDAILIDAPGFHMFNDLLKKNGGRVPDALTNMFVHHHEFDAPPIELTRHIRQWSVMEGFRTVILNLSHADVEEERIQYLVQGADELLDTSMSSDELCIRVLSHIRRHLDHYQSPLTRQPNLSLLSRMFTRRLRQSDDVPTDVIIRNPSSAVDDMGDWSIAVFYIASLDVYGSLYGEESKVRILQHVASILGQMLHVPDWVFHIEDNMFVVLSTPDRLDRIMPITMKRLEGSMVHFISDADQERGFFMLKQDTLYSRIPMLRVAAGVLSTVTNSFTSLNAVISKGLYMTHKAMTQLPVGEPAWLSDKLALGGGVTETEAAIDAPSTPYIIVVEPDAALAFLLQQTISMNGMEVDVMPSISEATQAIKERMPVAVIVDPFLSVDKIDENMNVWEPLKALKAAAPNAFVLATCNHDNDEEALINGADAYLPKPYQLFPLLGWLDGVVKSRL